MLRVGLTGGIGSGKTTVASLFADLGVPVIDTDQIAHALTAPGTPALDTIRTEFGQGMMQTDGSLNRAALRRLVFDDAAARKKLESILHPFIRREVTQRLGALDAPYALVVIPLLVETGGYPDLLDRVLVVDCPEALQISRVMARSGLTRDEVMAILGAQARRDERLAIADDLIVNDGGEASLRKAVSSLHQRYLKRASAPSS